MMIGSANNAVLKYINGNERYNSSKIKRKNNKTRSSFKVTADHEFGHGYSAVLTDSRLTSARTDNLFIVFDERNQASVWTVDGLVEIGLRVLEKKDEGEDDTKVIAKNIEKINNMIADYNTRSQGEIFFAVNDDLKGLELEDTLLCILDANGTRKWDTLGKYGDSWWTWKIRKARLLHNDDCSNRHKASLELKDKLNTVSMRKANLLEKNSKEMLHIKVIETVEKHLNIDLKP